MLFICRVYDLSKNFYHQLLEYYHSNAFVMIKVLKVHYVILESIFSKTFIIENDLIICFKWKIMYKSIL